MLFAAALALVLAAVPAAAGGDIVCLKDGRVVQGPPMRRVDGGIEITYKNGVVRVPTDLILDAVLAEDAKIAPKTDEEKQQAVKGFVRFESKWITPKQRDDLVTKRVEKHRKRLEEMKAHGEWRNRQILDTRYFRFEYTVPQHIFEPYRDAMEAYFGEFAKTWRLKTPKSEDRLPVCFHSDFKSFQQIGGVKGGVIGYFRYVRPWDLNIFYERLDPALTEDVMFHEANHYLQQLINVQFSYPHFPGESLAEYYGASSWDPVKKKLTVGLIQEGRLCEIETDVAAGTRVELHHLITADGIYEHYTWGWAFVHFLMNDARYTAKFQRFFLSLPDAKKVERQVAGMGDMYTIEQKDVLEVFMREMGLKDANALRGLEAEFNNYVDRTLKLVTCSGKEKAGFKAKSSNRKLRAVRLFKEAIEMGSRNALVFHSLAEIYAGDGKRTEAFEMWEKALEIDPLNGTFYARMAFFVDDTDKKEARRLLELARELGSDDIWIHLEFGEEDPEPKKPGDEPGDKPGKPQ